MKISRLLVAAGLVAMSLASSLVSAQQLQPIQMAPVSKPSLQAITPIDSKASEAHTVEFENQQLRKENAKLREENVRLQAEGEALATRVNNFSSLGGSEVHAYCPNPDTSRNTAGAEADCRGAGYTCEPVSGLCRTSCQTSDMCAGGFTCDTAVQQCVYTSGG
jgi:hypothetical protein